MNIKIQNRQSGKSYDIAQIMKKNKYAVCIQPTEGMKRHFCHKHNISLNRVKSWGSYLGGFVFPKNRIIYIDEIGFMINIQLLNKKIGYATHTNEQEKTK